MHGRDNTLGRYSDVIVVNEDFVLKVPEKLKPEVAAPILCAGVTAYSPLKRWGVKPGDRVGIIGFGGLGATGVLETDAEATKQLKSSFGFSLSAIPEKHDLQPVCAAGEAGLHDLRGGRAGGVGGGEQHAGGLSVMVDC